MNYTFRVTGNPDDPNLTDRLSAYLQLESGGYLLLETGGKVKLENTTGGVAGTQTDRLPAFPT